MCDSVFVGDKAIVKYNIFTEKPSKKVARELAVALEDRIFADYKARKAETEIGNLNII